MEFHFEIVHIPRLYSQALNAMYRLPKDTQDRVDERKDVEDIPMHCQLGTETDALCATEEDEVIRVLITSFKKLLGVPKTDACCQNMVKLVGTHALFTVDVNENGVFCRKASVDGTVEVLVTKASRQAILRNGHHLILAARSGTPQMNDVFLRRVH